MTPKTLTRIGIALCIIGLLAVPQLAAASGQSTVVSLSVSEVVIDVDDEIRDLGYTVDGKEEVSSVFTITGSRVVISVNEVLDGKKLHASVAGGTLILGKQYIIVIPRESDVFVSLSVSYEDEEQTTKYNVPSFRIITESGDYTLERAVKNCFEGMRVTEPFGKILFRLDNI